MRKNQSISLILLLLFQFTLVIVANRFFVSDMREDIQILTRDLKAEGMQPTQVDAIASTLSMMKSNVSSYVNLVATFLIVANGSFMYGVIRKSIQGESP